jgi:hypothetical protein
MWICSPVLFDITRKKGLLPSSGWKQLIEKTEHIYADEKNASDNLLYPADVGLKFDDYF